MIRHKRAAIWFVITGVAATMLPLFWLGWRAVPEFIAQIAGNLYYWEKWPAGNHSRRGLPSRVLIGSNWSLAVMHAPQAATAIVMVSSTVLIAIAVHATLRHA